MSELIDPAGRLAHVLHEGKERVYALAPSAELFDWWCRANDLSPRDRRLILVYGLRSLQGLYRAKYIEIVAPRVHGHMLYRDLPYIRDLIELYQLERVGRYVLP